MSECMEVCTDVEDRLGLDMCDCTHVCRYHKYPARKHYSNSLIGPPGLCIDLFHSAYPDCLSLLYGGKHEEPVVVACPNPHADVSLELTTKPARFAWFRRFLVKAAAAVRWDIECPDTAVVLTIRNAGHKNCRYSYKSGDQFLFNLWLGQEMCPATFDAVYPTVHSLMRGNDVSYGDGGPRVVCPDPKSNITMNVTRVQESRDG